MELSITLLYLLNYSPYLNLIGSHWRFLKRKSVSGEYHPKFAAFKAAFKAAIADTPNQLSTTRADALASLAPLNFQEFGDVSLLAA